MYTNRVHLAIYYAVFQMCVWWGWLTCGARASAFPLSETGRRRCGPAWSEREGVTEATASARRRGRGPPRGSPESSPPASWRSLVVVECVYENRGSISRALVKTLPSERLYGGREGSSELSAAAASRGSAREWQLRAVPSCVMW